MMRILIALGLVAVATAWPAYEGCGVSSVPDQGVERPPYNPRIVGGWEVLPSEYPHQTTIRTQTDSFFCGGSIIGNNKVLTAAHCTDRRHAGNTRVGMGEHVLGEGLITEVLELHQHDGYDDWTLENDISVLVVPTITVNSAMLPLCPSSASSNADGYAGERLLASGWGSTSEGGPIAPVLLAVDMLGIDFDTCSASYEPGWVLDGMMCAGVQEGGKDTCQGDSGGALVHLNNGAYEQVGIVSWGIGCAQPDTPGVYTDAVYYKGWIAQYF